MVLDKCAQFHLGVMSDGIWLVRKNMFLKFL